MSTENNTTITQPGQECGRESGQECGRESGQECTYPPDPAYPTGSTKVLYDGIYTFLCPHCNLVVAVEKNQVNCHIFRHGNYITQRDSSGRAIAYGDSINPHAPKHICDELVSKDLIVGCGKPLQMYVSINPPHVQPPHVQPPHVQPNPVNPDTNSGQECNYYVRICDYI